MTPTDELLKEVVGMLRENERMFRHIHDKALHWMKVCAKNQFAEARWAQQKRAAWKGVSDTRALLAKVDAQSDEEM